MIKKCDLNDRNEKTDLFQLHHKKTSIHVLDSKTGYLMRNSIRSTNTCTSVVNLTFNVLNSN